MVSAQYRWPPLTASPVTSLRLGMVSVVMPVPLRLASVIESLVPQYTWPDPTATDWRPLIPLTRVGLTFEPLRLATPIVPALGPLPSSAQ